MEEQYVYGNGILAFLITKTLWVNLWKEKKMKQVLAVAGPIVGNFVAWTLISMLPVHPIVIFALVIMSGVLMICAMVYFGKKAAEGPSTQSQS